MGNTEFVLIILLLLVTAGGVLFLALRQNRMELILRDLEAEDIQDELVRIRGQVESTARMNAEFNAQLRAEVNGSIREGLREQSDQLREGFRDQSGEQRRSAKEQMDAMRSAAKIQSEQLLSTSKLLTESLLNMSDSMSRQINESMERMQESNEKRLDKIEGVVDEKLDRTLNERLDTNFKMVGDQLGKLYRSLGELEALSSGVTDLNRTLSNVKTRGVWGEVQLGRILEQTMARSQYEINVATKKNSDDRVEFAVRFPSQDGTEDIVYLPHALQTELIVNSVAVVHKVISRENRQQKEHEQNHSHTLIGLGALHHPAIAVESGIGRILLEKQSVHLIIISIQRPLMESQGCHSCLVPYVENNAVVGRHTIVEPFHLSWNL